MAAVTNVQWKTWQDWVNVAAGVVLALSPVWASFNSASAWPIVAGIVIAVVGLWALGTSASKAAEWVQVVVAVITFILPWIGKFATATGAWWTWILAVIVLVLALWSMYQYNKEA